MGLVSYSIFVQRFVHGEEEAVDTTVFRNMIAPYVVGDAAYGCYNVRAGDGSSAEIHVSDEPGMTGFIVTRFTSGAVMDLVTEIARALGACILLQEGVAVVADPMGREQLPPEFRESAVIGLTSAGIDLALTRA